MQKNQQKEIVRTICEDLLDYDQGQVFPTLIARKLKELEHYEPEVILATLTLVKESVRYQFSQGGKFDGDQHKIFYLFAVLKNHINDVQRKWRQEQRHAQKAAAPSSSGLQSDISLESLGAPVTRKAKDIGDWLGEDDL